MSQETTIAATELLRNVDDLFHRLPLLTALHVTDAEGLVESLAQLPILERLTTFGLSGNWVTPAEARALAQSPYLANLEELTMHNCALGDEGIREFAILSNLVHLRAWFLTDNGLTDDGLNALGSSDRFPAVESLSFGHYGMSPKRQDSITREGLFRLAQSSRLPQLSAIHWYELTDRRDVAEALTREELTRKVQMVTHVEQIW